MKFLDYFLIQEVKNIEKTDVSDIEFEQAVTGAFKYRFSVGPDDYVVGFSPDTIYIRAEHSNYEVITDEAYSIWFEIDSGDDEADAMGMTHKGTPHQVYSQVLKAAKKFLQEHKPEGLKFTGSEDAMNLVYKRFYDRYLSEKPGRKPEDTYLQLDSEQYLRKDVYEKLPSMLKSDVSTMMNDWRFEKDMYFQKISDTKSDTRMMSRELQRNYVGKFIDKRGWGRGFRVPGFVYNVTPHALSFLSLFGGKLDNTDLSLEDMDIDSVQRTIGQPRQVARRDLADLFRQDVDRLTELLLTDPRVAEFRPALENLSRELQAELQPAELQPTG